MRLAKIYSKLTDFSYIFSRIEGILKTAVIQQTNKKLTIFIFETATSPIQIPHAWTFILSPPVYL
jgi:hypothetical protein